MLALFSHEKIIKGDFFNHKEVTTSYKIQNVLKEKIYFSCDDIILPGTPNTKKINTLKTFYCQALILEITRITLITNFNKLKLRKKNIQNEFDLVTIDGLRASKLE